MLIYLRAMFVLSSQLTDFFFLYKTHTVQFLTCHFEAPNILQLVKLKLRSVDLAALL